MAVFSGNRGPRPGTLPHSKSLAQETCARLFHFAFKRTEREAGGFPPASVPRGGKIRTAPSSPGKAASLHSLRAGGAAELPGPGVGFRGRAADAHAWPGAAGHPGIVGFYKPALRGLKGRAPPPPKSPAREIPRRAFSCGKRCVWGHAGRGRQIKNRRHSRRFLLLISVRGGGLTHPVNRPAARGSGRRFRSAACGGGHTAPPDHTASPPAGG